MKKAIIFTILFILMGTTTQKVYCVQIAEQVLQTTLPQVLEIEKIIVETTKYDRDDPLPAMKIKSTNSLDPNTTILELSPIQVQLRTNSATPITVYAQFKELKNKTTGYNFSSSNIFLTPDSIVLNNPYDHIITDVFTPYVYVTPTTDIGLYRGSLYFTLGAI